MRDITVNEAAPTPNASTPLLRGAVQDVYHNAKYPDHDEHDETTVILQEIAFTKLLVIMCTAWLGIFLGAIDTTIIATLSGPICSDFNSLQMFSWVASAYLIGNAACQPLCGRLTDILGRGPGLVASNMFFAVGNLICGVAQDSYTLIFGRAVAGIGGGGLMCIATFLASDLIPLRKRGLFQGIANLWYGIGCMVGGVAGGFLHDHTAMGWRLAFFVQVPPALFCAVAAYILVVVPPKQSKNSMLSRIDYLGALLTVAFVVLLLLGLGSTGSALSYTHPLALGAVALSLVILLVFVWWESRAGQPIIPVMLLRDRTVFSSCSISFVSVMIMMTAVFYIPLYLQVRGESATAAGLKMLFSPASMPIGALSVGYVMKQTGRYVGLTATSILVLATGVCMCTFAIENSPGWLMYAGLFLLGGAYTAVLTTTQIACIAAVDHSQQAVITSTICE